MIIHHILEIIRAAGIISADVAFTDYHTSYRRMRRMMRYGVDSYLELNDFKKHKESERNRFNSLLWYLKKKGLIERKKGNKWKITEGGIKWLKTHSHKLIPFESNELKKGEKIIIIFDIPEKSKKKRDWLRKSLVNIDFKMLQKSVWMGDSKLPEEFILEMKNLNIISYIHIFSIKEKGSIDFK